MDHVHSHHAKIRLLEANHMVINEFAAVSTYGSLHAISYKCQRILFNGPAGETSSHPQSGRHIPTGLSFPLWQHPASSSRH